MKRLYEVNVRMYVMAKDEQHARDVAIEEAGYELDMCTVEAEEAVGYYPDWKGAIPFGSDDDKTVDEIIKELKAPHKP